MPWQLLNALDMVCGRRNYEVYLLSGQGKGICCVGPHEDYPDELQVGWTSGVLVATYDGLECLKKVASSNGKSKLWCKTDNELLHKILCRKGWLPERDGLSYVF